MNKHRKALAVAMAMTVLLSLGMLVIGGAALFNPYSTPVLAAPASAQTSVAASAQSDLQARNSQLEDLVSQYQQREQQYQDQLASVQSQLEESQTELAQYQQVLQFLVDRGVLRLNRNGQLTLGRDGD